MGVASLVLGIISILVAWIPFCGFIAFIPALIGLVLGIISAVLGKKHRTPIGMGIAGAILNGLSLLFILFYILIFSAATLDASDNFEAISQSHDSLQQTREEFDDEWEDVEKAQEWPSDEEE